MLNNVNNFVLIIFLMSNLFVLGQETDVRKKDSVKQKNLTIVPFPSVAHNKVLGWGGGINVSFNYKVNPKKDSLSPSSTTLISPMYFENKSWYVGMFQRLYFKENKWRVQLMGGYQDIFFQFNTEAYFAKKKKADSYRMRQVGLV